MIIKIKDDEGHKFKLWLPTCLLKSKFLLKKLTKYGIKDVKPLFDLTPKIYKSLKKYIRKHGHFVLVDIDSDGNQVSIKV